MGERYEWAFHQRRYIGMTKKHRNRCSTSLILREVQNHNEISLYPTKMPLNKKITSIDEDVEKLEPHTVLVGLQNGATIL